MRVVNLVLLVAMSLVAIGCAGDEAAPSPTPQSEPTAAPTPNVAATVEASIRATREAESSLEATIEARVAATKAAEPTATPRPSPTPTAQPTPVPTATPTPRPTATPYPTPGGNPTQDEIADMAGRLYDCIQVNDEFRRIYEHSAAYGATAEGMTQDAAEDLAALMLSSREFFILAFQEVVTQDPSMGYTLSTEMDWCLDTLHGQASETVEPNPIIGKIYDCLQENREMREVFQEGAVVGVIAEGLTREAAEELVASILSNRGFFILSFEEAQKLDPSVLSDMESMLAECQ